jgi:hypothetical protein
MRLRNVLANGALVLASIVSTLLAVEVVLRLLPIAWAPPVQPPTAENPIQRYAANAPFTWSIDPTLNFIVRGRTNAQGFVADYDYDPRSETPLVAVVGDSFMEALRVPFRETLTGRLQAMLGDRGRAYVFAQSGSPLSQYVAYAQHACATYRPERLVVTIVGNDFDQSLYKDRQRDGIHHLYPGPDGSLEYRLTPLPPPRLLERVARHSALALYLARNVGISNRVDWMLATGTPSAPPAAAPVAPPAALPEAPRGGAAGAVQAPQPAPPATPRPALYVGNTLAVASQAKLAEGREVIGWFLSALPSAACLPPRHIVLVVDAIRPELYGDQRLRDTADASYFGQMRATLIEQAAQLGFAVVDMQPRFLKAYAEDGRRFEFPTDNHWASHGHEVAAQAVGEALAGWPAAR